MNKLVIKSGRINRHKEMPADLMATSSNGIEVLAYHIINVQPEELQYQHKKCNKESSYKWPYKSFQYKFVKFFYHS